MATLTVTQFTPNSSVVSTILGPPIGVVSSSNGDAFPWTGKEVVLLQNSTGGAITASFTGQKADPFGGAASLHTFTLSIPTSSNGLTPVGPFGGWMVDSNGLVQMTYSAGGMRVAVVAIAPQS